MNIWSFVFQVVPITDRRLNDNEWHTVDIQQSGPQIFRIRVDDDIPVSVNRPASIHNFDITDHLYVGSVPENKYGTMNQLINSRNGFGGCLATLKVDGKLYVLPDEAVSSSHLVVAGCTGKYCIIIFIYAGISPSETVLISGENNYCDINTTYPLYITSVHCYNYDLLKQICTKCNIFNCKLKHFQ